MEKFVTMASSWNLVENANIEKIKDEDKFAFLHISNMGICKDDISFKDVASLYRQTFIDISMEEKKKKAHSFMQVHKWVMNKIGFYNLKHWQVLPEIKGQCNTCRGTGLYAWYESVKQLTSCPVCMGTGYKITQCKRCNGMGCDFCNERGYFMYYGSKKLGKKGTPCDLCGSDTPFGPLKGSGKVLRELKIVKDIGVCRKCSGTGRKNK